MSHWPDELTAWWDDVRHWLAFAIAPLAVPLIMIMGVGLDGAPAIGMIASLSLIVGYFGTLLFGLPLYLLLRSCGHTGFWLAPVGGYMAGLAITYVVRSWLDIPLLTIAGPCGAAVGALLWLIARPDRPRRSANGE
jgi:hypothetical protein